MNHIPLESQDEAVKRFFLSLPDDSQGALVELNGQLVACILPPPKASNRKTEEWTDAKNERRCELIDRKHKGPALMSAEVVELGMLQEEMLRYRQKVAPLPIEDARRLHQELLSRAVSAAELKRDKNALWPGPGCAARTAQIGSAIFEKRVICA